jgi:protein-disulfide isomerase
VKQGGDEMHLKIIIMDALVLATTWDEDKETVIGDFKCPHCKAVFKKLDAKITFVKCNWCEHILRLHP